MGDAQTKPHRDDDESVECLHCFLMAGLAEWAAANGKSHTDTDGGEIFTLTMPEVVSGMSMMLAEIAAHCATPKEASHVITRILNMAIGYIPEARNSIDEDGTPFLFTDIVSRH